jgi:hypothetical protein
MPGYVVTVGSVVNCTHMGMGVLGGTANPRVKVMGLPVVNISLPVPISACPFMMPVPPPVPSPHPCIMGNWLPPSGAARVKSMGLPLVVQTSAGMVLTTTPPAPPVPFKVTLPAQARVKAM